MNTAKVLHITFCLLISFGSWSQSILEDFEKWSSGIGENYSCLIDYKLYKKGDSEVREKLSGNYAQDQNGSYFKAANTEYIWNNGNNLIVNHDVNIMVLRDQEKQSIPEQVDFTVYEKIADSMFVKQENNSTITYRIKYNDSLFLEYKMVDITFHKQRKQPISLTIYYKNEINFSKNPEKPDWGVPILKIKYKNFSPKVDSYIYDISRFLEIMDDNSIKLKSAYTDYELHNLKQQKQ